jgi:hypothetical protein
MYVEVHDNTEIGNMRKIAKFLLSQVAMHELKVAQSHHRPEFFQWCCPGGSSLRMKVLNNFIEWPSPFLSYNRLHGSMQFLSPDKK